MPVDRVYDLEERTARFGEAMIRFVGGLSKSVVSRSLISQVIRSSTSIGANYMEADGAESSKDFRHKIALCKKEAKETTHWLRMLAVAIPSETEICRELRQEAHELALIFSAVIRSSESRAESPKGEENRKGEEDPNAKAQMPKGEGSAKTEENPSVKAQMPKPEAQISNKTQSSNSKA